MPKATTTALGTERFDLKTLAEGYVVLKRMSFGEAVERRQLTRITLEGSNSNRKNFKGEIEMGASAVALFEFRHCIVEHNLEGDDGQLLDLKNPVGFAQLDSRIGQEIEDLISKMNNFEEEDDLQENLTTESKPA